MADFKPLTEEEQARFSVINKERVVKMSRPVALAGSLAGSGLAF